MEQVKHILGLGPGAVPPQGVGEVSTFLSHFREGRVRDTEPRVSIWPPLPHGPIIVGPPPWQRPAPDLCQGPPVSTPREASMGPAAQAGKRSP